MDQVNVNSIAIHVKDGRLKKGYTQQELSDLTGISIRSVQRIESGDVVPREYTLKVLARHLELDEGLLRGKGAVSSNDAVSTMSSVPAMGSLPSMDVIPPKDEVPSIDAASQPPVPQGLNKARKIVLSIGIGLLLILGTGAFISQSPKFPETTFEAFCLWSGVTVVYMVVIFKLWK